MTRPWWTIMRLFIASILSAASRKDRIAAEETPCSSGAERLKSEPAPAPAGGDEHPTASHASSPATTIRNPFMNGSPLGTKKQRLESRRREEKRRDRGWKATALMH